jgi:hypothetical protein
MLRELSRTILEDNLEYISQQLDEVADGDSELRKDLMAKQEATIRDINKLNYELTNENKRLKRRIKEEQFRQF